MRKNEFFSIWLNKVFIFFNGGNKYKQFHIVQAEVFKNIFCSLAKQMSHPIWSQHKATREKQFTKDGFSLILLKPN